MKTELDKLCEREGVTLKLVYGGSLPREDWPYAHAYKATIKYKRRQYSVPFYTGHAWTEDPTVGDVLSSLLSDASCYETYQNIDEFYNEFYKGSNKKISEVLEAYMACGRTQKRLTAIFGEKLQEFYDADH